MARKKEFDTDVALEAATDFFRRHGYANSSIDDLMRCTALSRSSLYSTFGSKEELFLSALELYFRRMMDRVGLDHALAPRQALGSYFADLVDALTGWDDGGCLLTNSCAEYFTLPHAAKERVTAGLAEQRTQLLAYFRTAGRREELPAETTATQLADTYLAVRQSLCLLSKASAGRKRLLAIVDTSLRIVA